MANQYGLPTGVRRSAGSGISRPRAKWRQISSTFSLRNLTDIRCRLDSVHRGALAPAPVCGQ